MSNNDFRDAQGQIDRTRGVLDGSGLGSAWSDQEKVDDHVSEDPKAGWVFQCRCQTCGKPLEITISWWELLVASMRLVPDDPTSGQPWVLYKGYLYPPITCGCGAPVHVPIGVDKATRCIDVGLKMGYLTPQWIQTTQRDIQARAGATRR